MQPIASPPRTDSRSVARIQEKRTVRACIEQAPPPAPQDGTRLETTAGTNHTLPRSRAARYTGS